MHSIAQLFKIMHRMVNNKAIDVAPLCHRRCVQKENRWIAEICCCAASNWYYSTLTVLADRLNESLFLKAKVETHVDLVIFPSLLLSFSLYVMHNALFCYIKAKTNLGLKTSLNILIFAQKIRDLRALEANGCLLRVRSARRKQLISINNHPKMLHKKMPHIIRSKMNREFSSMSWFSILVTLNR